MTRGPGGLVAISFLPTIPDLNETESRIKYECAAVSSQFKESSFASNFRLPRIPNAVTRPAIYLDDFDPIANFRYDYCETKSIIPFDVVFKDDTMMIKSFLRQFFHREISDAIYFVLWWSIRIFLQMLLNYMSKLQGRRTSPEPKH